MGHIDYTAHLPRSDQPGELWSTGGPFGSSTESHQELCPMQYKAKHHFHADAARNLQRPVQRILVFEQKAQLENCRIPQVSRTAGAGARERTEAFEKKDAKRF